MMPPLVEQCFRTGSEDEWYRRRFYALVLHHQNHRRAELDVGDFGRLIVTWNGQAPDWKDWISKEVPAAGLHTIHLWDLSLSASSQDQDAKKPLSPALSDLRDTFEHRRILKFLKGYFVGSQTPYGLRLVRMCRRVSFDDGLKGNVLVPGAILTVN